MNLALFLRNTVIIIPLYSWDPVPINRAYEELLGLDVETLRFYHKIQRQYLNDAHNELERKKVELGLKLIGDVIRRKEHDVPQHPQ